MQMLPHLHSLLLGWSACQELTTLQPLSQLPSLTHLALNLPTVHQRQLYPSLSLCSRLVSLQLGYAAVSVELVHSLAQLPLLQRLHLLHSNVEEQTAGAWADLRSLSEIQLDYVRQANRLLAVVGSVPSLRILRWHCRAPRIVESDPLLVPQLAPLMQLLTAAPLVRVELVMAPTFNEWDASSSVAASPELQTFQQRVWDELQQLPLHLPIHVRMVAPDPTDDEE